jgi:DNA polymerase III sliding clamp (beta) subunit (PCNA family)
MRNLDKIMSDVLNLDIDTLSDDFLTNADNLKLMEKAAEGDTDAIESLRAAAAKDIV